MDADALRGEWALRRALLAVLMLGMVGAGTELVLLGHTESRWQWVPLVALPIGLMVTAAVLVRPSRRTIQLLRTVMVLFIVAGFGGLYLHYRSNVEFELEMYPGLKGLELFWKSITGAVPALAPGTMLEFGLLGLASTYRHPLVR